MIALAAGSSLITAILLAPDPTILQPTTLRAATTLSLLCRTHEPHVRYLATSDATTLVSVYKNISNPFGVSSAANVDTTNMAHVTFYWLDGVLEGQKGKYVF